MENTSDKMIREPVVAGQWYPQDREELKVMVQTFLNNVDDQMEKEKIDGELCALIAPHAGFVFSGQTAAYAFKQIENKKYKNVILLGPSHRMHINGASIFPKGAYKTPLGPIEINDTLAEKIMQEDTTLFKYIKEAHTEEHSLEALLPFLQLVIDNFKIVPIIMGQIHPEVCEKIASAIVKHVENLEDVIIVTSSDMSHYPSYTDACKVDSQMLSAIVSMAPNNVLKTSATLMGSGIRNLHTTLCGEIPVITTMLICNKLGATEAKVLNYMNSGNAPMGSKDRVVGYGAVAFYKKKSGSEKVEFKPLDTKVQKELLTMARTAIESYVENRKIPEFKPTFPVLMEKRGVFVTLTKNGELRGCIGRHSADTPLHKLVPEMTIASAFQDHRFQPVAKEELENIKIKLSVYLTNVYEIESIDEYQLGNDGIILSIGERAATFLPEVPIEQGWTKKETLAQLARKAGLQPDAWKKDAKLFVYKTQIFSE